MPIENETTVVCKSSQFLTISLASCMQKLSCESFVLASARRSSHASALFKFNRKYSKEIAMQIPAKSQFRAYLQGFFICDWKGRVMLEKSDFDLVFFLETEMQ